MSKPDELHCPSCGSPIAVREVRTKPGPPDAKSYQCAGSRTVDPCDWLTIWPNSNVPMTSQILSMGVGR